MKAGDLAAALRPLALIAVAFSFNVAAEVVPPVTSLGPYAVGCSNVEQDFTRIPPGESAQAYWEGLPRNGTGRFITDLLVDPARSLVYQQAIPNDSGSSGRLPAGRCRTCSSSAIRPILRMRARTTCCRPATSSRTCSAAAKRRSSSAMRRGRRSLYSHGLGGSPDLRRLHQVAGAGRELRLRRRSACSTATCASPTSISRASRTTCTRCSTIATSSRCRRCARCRCPRRSTPCSAIPTGAITSTPRASAASARASAASRCCCWRARSSRHR